MPTDKADKDFSHDYEPIEEKHVVLMNRLAVILQEFFKGHGFALFVFELNSIGGRMNYISNAERHDMIKALEEFIIKNKEREKGLN